MLKSTVASTGPMTATKGTNLNNAKGDNKDTYINTSTVHMYVCMQQHTSAIPTHPLSIQTHSQMHNQQKYTYVQYNIISTHSTLHKIPGHIYACTVYVRIEARASISFQKVLTRPLFKPSFLLKKHLADTWLLFELGFYLSPASIQARLLFK